MSNDARELKRRQIVLWFFNCNQGQRGKYSCAPLKSRAACKDGVFNIQRCGGYGEMKKGALTVAQLLDASLPSGLVGPKYDFDLADKFLEPQINRSERRGGV